MHARKAVIEQHSALQARERALFTELSKAVARREMEMRGQSSVFDPEPLPVEILMRRAVSFAGPNGVIAANPDRPLRDAGTIQWVVKYCTAGVDYVVVEGPPVVVEGPPVSEVTARL
jgi:hypothetical protein